MRLLIITLLVALAGCTAEPVKVQYVDKPVPFCPAPPTIETAQYLVDQLTDADKADPGKVGQAYKHDMVYLRKVNKIYKMIVEQYGKSSANFDEVKKEIDKLVAPNQ